MNLQKFLRIIGLSIVLMVITLSSCSKQDLPSGVISADTRASLTAVSNFGTNPGALKMYYYAPSNPKSPAALVVALHGCTQSASEYADRTEWHVLANKYGFYVVFPEQQSSNNQNKCFNWFEPGDIARGQGEALSIKQMIDYMKSKFNIDSSKIFVTGLSAGGAMTAVMMAAYPDVFAGGAVMAGIPYKCATTMTDAFSCMSPGVDKTPQQWGDLVRSAYSGYSGPYPTLMVFQGSSDYTVKDLNMTELVDQWTNVHSTDQTPEVTETFRTATRKIYRNAAGKDVVVTYYINGMGHAITVDPGSNTDQGGTTGAYSEDKDIYSSYYAAKFWGLDNSDTTAPTVNITSPTNGSTVSGTVKITATASDNVGVAKVEFYKNGVKLGEDTTAPYEYSWNTSNEYNGQYNITAKAYDTSNNLAEATISVTVTGGLTDTTAPTVNITSPTNGSTVNGTVKITATASDNYTGVTKVEFYINNTKVGEDTTSPYEYNWDTSSYSEGSYSLKAIAYDGAGNTAVDNDTSVNVVHVIICHSETASDTATNHYVAGRITSNQYTTYGTRYGYINPFTVYHLLTQYQSNGITWVDQVDLEAMGCSAGSGGGSDTTAPTVNITSPTNGSTVSGTVTITATASDNVGVTKVEFYINNTKVGEDTTSPYEYNWDTTGYSNGTYSLKAVAYDAAGNSAIDNDTSVTVSNSGSSTTVSFNSISTDDGYVKANADGSSPAVGTYTTLAIGRGSDGKYNRAILSFDTSSIPDNAVITRAYIVVTYSSNSGDPWANGNSLVIDIKNGYFGSASTIGTDDWAAAATASVIATIDKFTSGTKQSSDFNTSGLSAINKTGKTQLKLRFANNQTSTAYIFIKEGTSAKLYVTYTSN
ncbi:MAG TPA: PHB depolymerase family esterase [Spirochaetota bacterium]|nr:PHB depolymerase family esterase [Spirochaetota bacterium]HOM38672.1 PHB depolymerase family esterase [Spirochaetota bacterium]HPQ49812.1 PHB depolymerase family esterase [Spirochaetota bacterium]